VGIRLGYQIPVSAEAGAMQRRGPSIWLFVTHLEANTHVIITRTGEVRVSKCTAVICRLVEVFFAMICAALLLISVVL